MIEEKKLLKIYFDPRMKSDLSVNAIPKATDLVDAILLGVGGLPFGVDDFGTTSVESKILSNAGR